MSLLHRHRAVAGATRGASPQPLAHGICIRPSQHHHHQHHQHQQATIPAAHAAMRGHGAHGRSSGMHAMRGCRVVARAAPTPGSNRVPNEALLEVAKKAALVGAEIVMEGAGKPRSISRKEGTDIVTETDAKAEKAITAAILAAFPDHAVLGEEGGLTGSPHSEYLWCIDPLDGTVNFAHGIPGFNVSVGVLRHATPVAGCVVEFVGGQGGWSTRTFAAHRNGGATLDGKTLRVSSAKELSDAVIATELVWYPDMWPYLQVLHKEFTEHTRGVRMSGAAAANLCHLAEGSVDVYWQYRLKPWDAAAGIVIAEEAGARISTGSGTAYSPFDKSLLATNDALYEKALAVMAPVEEKMLAHKIDLAPYSVQGYRVKAGPQLH